MIAIVLKFREETNLTKGEEKMNENEIKKIKQALEETDYFRREHPHVIASGIVVNDDDRIYLAGNGTVVWVPKEEKSIVFVGTIGDEYIESDGTVITGLPDKDYDELKRIAEENGMFVTRDGGRVTDQLGDLFLRLM